MEESRVYHMVRRGTALVGQAGSLLPDDIQLRRLFISREGREPLGRHLAPHQFLDVPTGGLPHFDRIALRIVEAGLSVPWDNSAGRTPRRHGVEAADPETHHPAFAGRRSTWCPRE